MPKRSLGYYIGGKPGRDETEIHQLRQVLDSLGHRCLYDWTEHSLTKPWVGHEVEAQTAGQAMLVASSSADLSIFLLGPDLIGVYIELGAALLAALRDRYQKIILIGTETEVTRSVFYFQPAVVRCTSIEAALDYIAKLPL